MNGTRHRLDAHPWREWIMRGFIRVEDAVYVGLGTLLAAMALALLVAVAISFAHTLLADTLPGHVVELLDRILLILMIVEILYTVQVSFREHALVPEPFLIVGLIAAVRRILVTTAEFARTVEQGGRALPERHDRAGRAHRHGRRAGGFALDVATARIECDGRARLVPALALMEPRQRAALGGAGRLARRGGALGGCRGAFGRKPLDVLLEDLLAERADVLGTDAALLVDEE